MIISKKKLEAIKTEAYLKAYKSVLGLMLNTTDALIDADKFVLLATNTICNGKATFSVPVPAQYNRYQDALSAAKRLKLDDKGIHYKIVQNVKHKENENGSEN